MNYDSLYPTFCPPHKLETDWACNSENVML